MQSLRCKDGFISNIIHQCRHQKSGVIIYLPRVYVLGETVFIGRLAETVDLRLPSTSDVCNQKDLIKRVENGLQR